ncbi:hypothetical protein TL16_g08146 [Triparma laevis f. inornata]|uniref:fructokinase n=1 Tax=Triparma laevis f. inornata TaxID=1714386 RepID=A0A9W7AWW7_9STRA|nr:hypothetical protein TL16_g08146 [Triparma laevis f. inornata]
MIGAVEAGGTSFVVAFSPVSDPTTILHRYDIETTTPTETLEKVCECLKKHSYVALGVATFGPADLNPDSHTYGHITTTPKAAWLNTDLLSPLRSVSPSIPLFLDTDVNAPALSEFSLNPKPGTSSCAYITVGTGVGVGLVINGKTVKGLMHPEGGHVGVRELPNDTFEGYSWGSRAPFKGKRTVESLASAVAITERLGIEDRSQVKDLKDEEPVWDHVANALANLCVSLVLLSSVERIVISGGVMKREILLSKIRSKTTEILNGYVPTFEEEIIQGSKFGNEAGIIGALNLAKVGIEGETNGGGKVWEFLRLGAMAGLGVAVGMAISRKK